jgi:hypothetical protein
MTVGLILGALLALSVVIYVAAPFLREPDAPVDRLVGRDALELQRLALIEERDRLQEALRELEFDHRTGKLSDEDYRILVGPLRRRVADARRALEPRGEGKERVRAAG